MEAEAPTPRRRRRRRRAAVRAWYAAVSEGRAAAEIERQAVEQLAAEVRRGRELDRAEQERRELDRLQLDRAGDAGGRSHMQQVYDELLAEHAAWIDNERHGGAP